MSFVQRLSSFSAALLLLPGIVPLRALSSTPSVLATQQSNQQKAHTLLAQTIQALGGAAWFHLDTARMQVRVPQFFQGTPTGTILTATITSEPPDKALFDVRKLHYVQLFLGDNAWEITYKGIGRLPQKDIDSARRIKWHSLNTVLGKWYDDPATVLIDEGPSQIERRPTEKIKVINSANDAVTLQIDSVTHLPLQLSFTWRDPRFRDKTLETTEYDDYHTVDGIATPFSTTQSQNGQVITAIYVQTVKYHITIPQGFFNPDRIAAHLKK